MTPPKDETAKCKCGHSRKEHSLLDDVQGDGMCLNTYCHCEMFQLPWNGPLPKSRPIQDEGAEVMTTDSGKFCVYIPCGIEIADCHDKAIADWICAHWNAKVSPPAAQPEPLKYTYAENPYPMQQMNVPMIYPPKPAQPESQPALDEEEFFHEPDCPCYSEQHSIDCKNCECQWPKCNVPPAGWSCSRKRGHSGPCAATPTPPSGQVAGEVGGEEKKELRELLSDAISMLDSGFHKRQLNMKLVAIDEKYADKKSEATNAKT